jgi:pyridoxamine 5'-phosphate oxidase
MLFFTNYNSRKAREIDANPNVALTLFWRPLERQIIIDGKAVRASREESEAYFRTRPDGTQVGAWASEWPGRVVNSREELEEAYQRAQDEHRTAPVPSPPYWGGYTVVPHRVEFWQGRPYRLHDRIAYCSTPEGWIKERLVP